MTTSMQLSCAFRICLRLVVYTPLLLDDEECCYALPVLCLGGSDKHPVHDGEFKLHGNMIHSHVSAKVLSFFAKAKSLSKGRRIVSRESIISLQHSKDINSLLPIQPCHRLQKASLVARSKNQAETQALCLRFSFTVLQSSSIIYSVFHRIVEAIFLSYLSVSLEPDNHPLSSTLQEHFPHDLLNSHQLGPKMLDFYQQSGSGNLDFLCYASQDSSQAQLAYIDLRSHPSVLTMS